MTPPYWTDCLPDISEQLAGIPRLLVATDFDGTLAPIVDRPDDAAAPAESLALLEKLAALPGVRVAVLSGRALADIQARVNLPGMLYAGNHGLEMAGAGLDLVHPEAIACRESLTEAAAWLTREIGSLPGVVVENKGLSLSVHYRLADSTDIPRITAALTSAGTQWNDLARHDGKMVYELRPCVLWNKGYALDRLLRRLGLPHTAAVFIGDDRTDEDGFTALRGLGATFHVGPGQDTIARWRLDDPHDTTALLAWLYRLRGGKA